MSSLELQHAEFNVGLLEERLAERSDQLEQLHMEAAIDAQLIIDNTQSSSLANLVAAADARNMPDSSSATPNEKNEKNILDDYLNVNPHSVDHCFSPYVPSQADRITAFVSFAGLNRDDVLLDLGCGDGRVCISAVQLIAGCRAVGVDVSPLCIQMAQQVLLEEEGVDPHRCQFVKADATMAPDCLLAAASPLSTLLLSATIVYLYTYPTLLKKLVPLLERLMESGKVERVVTLTYHLTDNDDDDAQVTIGATDEKNDFRLYTRISSKAPTT